jgi:protein-disulfide isomerase
MSNSNFAAAATRRSVLRLAGALALSPIAALAADESWYSLTGDDGAPVQNFRIAAELDPAHAPGALSRGPQGAGVILYEFFDYNCAYCRKAAQRIDAIVAQDADLRLTLINNPILSVGSVQAAKVQQAVLRLHGPVTAYTFHQRMFARRGAADGVVALEIARAMGLDAKKVEDSADRDVVGDVLRRQARFAADLGLAMTPSFAIAGAGILGWPGEKSLRAMIRAARECGEPVCRKEK